MESVLQLSSQKGKGKLFIVQFGEWGEVPFKLPGNKRAEDYAAALMLSSGLGVKALIREEIFRECVVSEIRAFEDIEIPAGIIHSVAELILYLSGIGSDKVKYTLEFLDICRGTVNSPTTMMKRIICSVFSGYTFETINDLSYQELINVFAQAEAMMLETGMIPNPYEFTNTASTKKTESADDLVNMAKRDMRDLNEMKGNLKNDPDRMQKLMDLKRKMAVRK